MLFIARPSSARLGVTAGLNGGVLKTGRTDCILAATEDIEFALSLTGEARLNSKCGELNLSVQLC